MKRLVWEESRDCENCLQNTFKEERNRILQKE